MIEGVKLVCFDLNKTLIKENTWYELNLAMGLSQSEDQDLMERYLRREITYEEGQKILEQKYIERGRATRDAIERVIEAYSYLDGAKEAVSYLKDKGYTIALLSGSVDLLVKKVASELSIEHFRTNNSLVFDENNYLKEIICLGDEVAIKARQLEQLCNMLSIPVTECACIGDGDNDLELFKKTKHGVTFRLSSIRPYAWQTIDTLHDLKNIF